MASLLLLPSVLRGENDWIPLSNGYSLDGWKSGGNNGSFRIEGGTIVAAGRPTHLYYTGPGQGASFKNFELKAEVLTRRGATSRLLFHTRFQSHGVAQRSLAIAINNTAAGHSDIAKSGSLHGFREIYKALAKDDEWFQLHVVVRAKQVQVWLNDTAIVDYVVASPPVESEDLPDRGTFALECQGPHAKVQFRNLLVKPLPDDLTTPIEIRPDRDDVYTELLRMHQAGFPVVDYHTHLKGGLTLPEALANSRRVGIMYGIAVNGGIGFPITNDAAVEDFLASMKGQPCFVALQGEGREWVTLFSRETMAKFDYTFTDAMTFTDDHGKRRRLWIPEEVGEIPDPQAFMEMLVDRILGVLNHEPIDIHANPTFLPDVIAHDYDRLWTPERMQKVIDAAKANGVAIEINNRYRIPSAAFIKRAKRAGVKFSFGTNNSDRNLGRMEYAVAMVKECGLTPNDIFVPKPDGEKAAQRQRSA
jgi:hypothetical protein